MTCEELAALQRYFPHENESGEAGGLLFIFNGQEQLYAVISTPNIRAEVERQSQSGGSAHAGFHKYAYLVESDEQQRTFEFQRLVEACKPIGQVRISDASRFATSHPSARLGWYMEHLPREGALMERHPTEILCTFPDGSRGMLPRNVLNSVEVPFVCISADGDEQ